MPCAAQEGVKLLPPIVVKLKPMVAMKEVMDAYVRERQGGTLQHAVGAIDYVFIWDERLMLPHYTNAGQDVSGTRDATHGPVMRRS
jgi:hypothetical protein